MRIFPSGFPLYLMLRKSKHVWLPALIILVVLVHPIQLFFFTGDFIKNEAAIPLVFMSGWIIQQWKSRPRYISLLALSATMILTALSHFGVFLLSLFIVLVWTGLELRRKGCKFWLITGSISILVLLVVGQALNYLVPDRFSRLMKILVNPFRLFENPAIANLKTTYFLDSLNFAFITGQLGAIGLALIAFRFRKQLAFSDRSFLGATLSAAFVFSSPLIGQEWTARLVALSFVPLIMAAVVLLLRVKSLVSNVAILTLVLAILFSSATNIHNGPKFFVTTQDRYSEFKQLMKSIKIPKDSVVVADHGSNYKYAYVLRKKDGPAGGYYGYQAYSGGGSKDSTNSDHNKVHVPTGVIIFESPNFSLSQIKPVIVAPPAALPSDFPEAVPVISGQVTLGIKPGDNTWVVKITSKNTSGVKNKVVGDLISAGFRLTSGLASSDGFKASFIKGEQSVSIELTQLSSQHPEVLYVVTSSN
ncbi:MAG: hypothetical protein EB055_00840 [Micrococcales bacterium]|nr:hypothetical protein [Micrococcales bacterium]